MHDYQSPNGIFPSEFHARLQEKRKHYNHTNLVYRKVNPEAHTEENLYIFYTPGELKNAGIQRLKLKRSCSAFFSNR